MDIGVFACILLIGIGLSSVCLMAVSTVEPPLEDYRPTEKKDGSHATD